EQRIEQGELCVDCSGLQPRCHLRSERLGSVARAIRLPRKAEQRERCGERAEVRQLRRGDERNRLSEPGERGELLARRQAEAQDRVGRLRGRVEWPAIPHEGALGIEDVERSEERRVGKEGRYRVV